jgi:hypothetical protein
MAGDTDFIALYQALGLDSSCTLEAFRQAYRKRVAVLHPDRRGSQVHSPLELQRLNALYTAAMEFHRRHGRLPGATMPAGAVPTPPEVTSSGPPRPVLPAEPRKNPRGLLALLLLVLTGLCVAGLLAPSESSVPVATLGAERGTQVANLSVPTHTPAIIKLGTRAQAVREVHGEPVSGWEKRWEYGPSWVAFRCGIVVDWYSSPLRPLKVATEHPVATAGWSPPKNCKD